MRPAAPAWPRDPNPHADRDRGSADALGLALLAGAMITLALAIGVLGRRVDARATANNAADAAAQAAAVERTPRTADARARAVAKSMLVNDESCATPTVNVDVENFGPGGTVSVTVSCTASTTGLELTGAPAQTMSTTAIAAIDPYKAVQVP